ncbi:MAG: hypothetical protein JWM44_1762 [Bacilli bacterium]|nr:hypothetical protein [Bacilli bacterium]
MKNALQNLVEIALGIGFAMFFIWRIKSIWKSDYSSDDSKDVVLFFAGLIVFYLTINIFKFFFKYSKNHRILSLGYITGAAFVVFEVLILYFAKSSEQIFSILGIVLAIWLTAFLTLLFLMKYLRRR